MSSVRAMPPALEALAQEQPRIAAFLAHGIESGRLGHAYLFCGPDGSGREEAAAALAKALLCPEGGDGTCQICRAIDEGLAGSANTEPDIQWLSPESPRGYVVDQIREVGAAATRMPVHGDHKVFVIREAERLGLAPANAFLKTLEEPPSAVVFILIAPSPDSVLPTIASRCQPVSFAAIDPDERAAAEAARWGVCRADARFALELERSVARARAFLGSPARRALAEHVLAVLASIRETSDAALLLEGFEIVRLADEARPTSERDQERALERDGEFLDAEGVKARRRLDKRRLQSESRRSLIEALDVMAVVAREGLARAIGADEAALEDPTLRSYGAAVAAFAAAGAAACLAALDAVRECATHLGRNITPALAVQVALLTIKEALCHTS